MIKKPKGTYDTDKPPVVTTVHRESTFTTFDMAKNLSKKLVSEKINNFVDKGAILYTDEYSIYSKIINYPKIIMHLIGGCEMIISSLNIDKNL